MNAQLDPYEEWMVKSNLDRINDEELDAASAVALLRARGYNRVATAVEQVVHRQLPENQKP